MTLDRAAAGRRYLGPSAEAHNALVDVWEDFQARRGGGAGSFDHDAAGGVGQTVLRVANYSGQALLISGVVSVREIVVDVATDEQSFRRQALPKAFAPSSDDDENRTLAVVLEGCASDNGSIAYVVVSGAAVVKVKAATGDDGSAAPKFVKHIEDDVTAAEPTDSEAEAFARVIYSAALDAEDEEKDETYALVLVGKPGSAGDTDCPEFDCGLAVGAALPRTTSTGILRMFRGQRPNTGQALTANNRPEKELQIGVGFLGRWPASGITSFSTARWLMPGMPYSALSQPDPQTNFLTVGGYSGGGGEQLAYNRRHLVARRHTSSRAAVEYDFTPPGYQGWLYVVGSNQHFFTGTGDFRKINLQPKILALRIYDGLVTAGVHFSSAVSGNMQWLTSDSPMPIVTEHEGTMLTYFDGGCCPRYDFSSDQDVYPFTPAT